MPWGNEELARLFAEMAELLVLTGETGFRSAPTTAAPAPSPATAPT